MVMNNYKDRCIYDTLFYTRKKNAYTHIKPVKVCFVRFSPSCTGCMSIMTDVLEVTIRSNASFISMLIRWPKSTLRNTDNRDVI